MPSIRDLALHMHMHMHMHKHMHMHTGWGWARVGWVGVEWGGVPGGVDGVGVPACVPSRPVLSHHHRRLACYLLPAC